MAAGRSEQLQGKPNLYAAFHDEDVIVTNVPALMVILLMLGGNACAAQEEASKAKVPAQSKVPAESTDGEAFFEKHVVPILKRRCYECHSHESGKAKGGLVLDSQAGWEKGGSEGVAIIPGEPDESLLMAAVRYDGYEMPPDEKLPPNEIALLEKWILMGAPDPRATPIRKIDPAKLWALQPVAMPDLPQVENTEWARDDLDRFVLHKLEQAGVSPNKDADRHTLLRRVTFDLTGLPPTPEEIDQFVADDSDTAYERVVDRLLNSPSFGDHWGRHWFDLSCYADLADIQGNVLIRDAWRYRDYVVESFNRDTPLDQFIHEQIAGDLLPFDDATQQRRQIIATGYLAIGPWTLQNYIKGQLDADVVDHQIDRIGRTFLGQTISCARCHDHKFDPIPTADYYAMAGIFHSTRTTSYDGPGVWSQINHVTLPDTPGATEAFEELSQDIARQQRELRDEMVTLQQQDDSVRYATKVSNGQANELSLLSTVPANKKGVEYQVSFLAGPTVWAAADQATAGGDGLIVQVLRKDDTVLDWHVHRPEPWSGKPGGQTLNPVSFTYRGEGTGNVALHITASSYTGRFGGAVDDVEIREVDSKRVVFREDFDKCRVGSTRGMQAHTGLSVYAKCSIPRWAGGGINHSHMVDVGQQGRPNLALQIFSGPKVAPTNSRLKEIQDRLARLTARLDASRPGQMRALAVMDVEAPADSPIYRRGDFQSLGPLVPRGFLSAVATSNDHEVAYNASGRLQLAQWLTDSENPLTSRVLANRIWHHLFGGGIVRTVDYFGVHGESPSHPQLLDFLAVRLRENDRWSVKRTVRRMVLSRTYQMSSAHNAEAFQVDPDNRLLWRMPRRRLTAESIRDAMLAASGQLDSGRGGPSLGLELPGNILGAGGNVNPANWGGKIPDYVRNRRTIYMPFRRKRPEGELELLSIFDFPHPNDITGARPNTTVATQALYLLNAPFAKQQAAALANRLAGGKHLTDKGRIERLYLLTLGRPADVEEIKGALDFLDQVSLTLSGNRAEAWTQLCHAMLGSNGFLFRE